jgi:hypothetical protein
LEDPTRAAKRKRLELNDLISEVSPLPTPFQIL